MQRPGDCNQDGSLDISDVICLVGFIFLSGPLELPCFGEANLSLADHNDDRALDVSDVISVVRFLFFLEGRPPPLGSDCVQILGCPDNSGRCF